MNNTETAELEAEAPRQKCPAPADFAKAIADYDKAARVEQWTGPRYRMTYRVLGEGPPLIVSQGIAATYRGYALMLNMLSSRFQTILYDYPGENPGDGAKLSKITHHDLVDDVFGLIDHLNIGRSFLFGPSFWADQASRLQRRCRGRRSRGWPSKNARTNPAKLSKEYSPR